MKPYDIGDTVENFSLPLLNGETVNFSDYKSKIILLVFTATWCPYCGAEAPNLENEIWQRFKDKGVQVFVVDVKEPFKLAQQFKDRYEWTFPVVVDESGNIAMKFAPQKEGLDPLVAVINSHFIIDKGGKIVFREFLNMERFDAKASHVAAELEKLV